MFGLLNKNPEEPAGRPPVRSTASVGATPPKRAPIRRPSDRRDARVAAAAAALREAVARGCAIW